VVLAIVLFGTPLAAIVVKYLIDDEQRELEQVADVAAVSTAIQLARGLPPGVPNGQRQSRLGVYDRSGHRVVGDGPLGADSAVNRAARGHRVRSIDADGELVVAVPIGTGASLLGVVRASTPPTEVYSRVGLVWLLMAGLASVDVLAVWLVARQMAARLSRPLEDLEATAHALGDGDFSAHFRAVGIPEIDAVAEALNNTAARFSDLVSRERAFSVDASHQLRTPLTALRLGLEVALEDPHQDLRETVVAALETTECLRRTVRDLLFLARDSTRDRAPLAVEAVVAELAKVWRPRLVGQGRTLIIRASPRLAPSTAAAAALRQILAVLLDNAIIHGAGTVTVTIRDACGALGIDVTDQGPGIAVPTARLFTRRGASTAGNGIGLALARRLAEAEGGRLNLSSPVPPTTFTLLLPALESRPAIAGGSDPAASNPATNDRCIDENYTIGTN
jgi:signal transduction histidine kinase